MANKLWAGLPSPVACWSCLHKRSGRAVCVAFPRGIPLKILDGSVGHREPYPGDNGIRYDPRNQPRTR